MKRRNGKIRWYPYSMLTIGIIFLVLAVADFAFSTPGPADWFTRNGFIFTYDGAHAGGGFAMCICIGLLCTGIGIYGVRSHKN